MRVRLLKKGLPPPDVTLAASDTWTARAVFCCRCFGRACFAHEANVAGRAGSAGEGMAALQNAPSGTTFSVANVVYKGEEDGEQAG